MWDSRGGPMAWIHVTLSFTHRILIVHMSSNGNINISNWKHHVMGIHKYPCSNNSCNMNIDPCNRNTETINTCISVNPWNSGRRIWNNCVQSIHVAMIRLYEITVSSGIAYPCINSTWVWNNSVICNSICVMVIYVHEMTVSGVLVYPCYDAISTWIIVFSITEYPYNRYTWICK